LDEQKAMMARLRAKAARKGWQSRYARMEPVSNQEAATVMAQRPERASRLDAAQRSKDVIKGGVGRSRVWAGHPERYDLEGVDTPRKSKAPDLEAKRRAKLLAARAKKVQVKQERAAREAAAAELKRYRKVQGDIGSLSSGTVAGLVEGVDHGDAVDALRRHFLAWHARNPEAATWQEAWKAYQGHPDGAVLGVKEAKRVQGVAEQRARVEKASIARRVEPVDTRAAGEDGAAHGTAAFHARHELAVVNAAKDVREYLVAAQQENQGQPALVMTPQRLEAQQKRAINRLVPRSNQADAAKAPVSEGYMFMDPTYTMAYYDADALAKEPSDAPRGAKVAGRAGARSFEAAIKGRQAVTMSLGQYLGAVDLEAEKGKPEQVPLGESEYGRIQFQTAARVMTGNATVWIPAGEGQLLVIGQGSRRFAIAPRDIKGEDPYRSFVESNLKHDSQEFVKRYS
jgi:hypothetical protein